MATPLPELLHFWTILSVDANAGNGMYEGVILIPQPVTETSVTLLSKRGEKESTS